MVVSFFFRGFRTLVVVLTFLSTFLLNGQVYAIEDAGLIPLASEANILKGSGQRGYAVCGKSVFVVDPRTRAILKQIDFQHMVNDIAIDDASNTLIVIEDKDKSWDIHFIHLQTWDRYAVVDKINDPVSVVIDLQRDLVVVASQSDRRLTLLGLGSQGIIGQIGLDARPSAMSYYAGGGILLVTESNDAGQGNGAGKSNFLQVVDVNGKRSLLTLTTDDEIATASVDEATARAAIGLRKGAISILDLSNLQQRSLTSLNTKLNDVELYGRSLIASDNTAGYIVNINPDTGQVKERLSIGNKTNLIARTSGYYLVSYKDGIRVVKGNAPEITAITPQKVMVASTGVQLQLTGVNFAQGSVVKVDAVALSTTFVSETTLTAALPDTLTTKAATHSVTVASTEGMESNAVSFSVENPVPQISSLVPIETNANTGAMTLEVLGSSFLVSDTSVNFNGSLRQTTYISAMKVTVNLLSSDTSTAGTYPVYAVNSAPGGGGSNTFAFTVKNPVPAITSVTPSEAAIGSGDVIVTIAGSGFVSSSDVYFGGTVVSKTALTYNSITATVPSSLLQTLGQYQVKVTNPTPGGGDSNTVQFTVKNPAPAITSVTPSEAAVGSGDVVVTIAGSGFISSSDVYFGTTVVSKTAITANSITATVPGSVLQTLGQYQVKVKNPAPGGGDSNMFAFTVKNPAPVITGITPSEAAIGTGDVVITIAGSGFIGSSDVYFGTTVVSKTAITPNSITVTVPGSMLQTAGQYPVKVKNPTPGGGDSNTVLFTVKNPVPAITSVTPSKAGVGSGDVVITIAGSGFVSSSDVYFGTTVVSKTAITASSITATVPGSLLQTAGQYPVKVTNPAPGGGDSSPYTFNVVPGLSIAITEPSDGATVDKRMTLVRGTFSWESGDVGIVVNGVPAEVSGRQWYANNVMLVVGANTITATITDASGNSKSTSITVNTTTTDNIVVLDPTIASGLAPLTTSFDVLEKLPNEVTGYSIDFEGDGSIDYTATEFEDVSYTYTTPGVYYPTITLTDSAGNTYTDRIAITVLDEAETDAMLRAKWNSMKAAFVAGDIEGGLQYICAGSRDDYRNALQFLDDMVPATFSSMQEISLIYVRNGVAKYRIRQYEVIEGSSVEITYYIYFERDTDGVMRIYRF
ncbi:MAG: hypothetical protein HQL02_11075 [Nitrospirae bacterium]|nr:hypothetical protein [Nitrospirota bacterium]